MTAGGNPPIVCIRGTGSIGEGHVAAFKEAGARVLVSPVREARLAFHEQRGETVVRDLEEARSRGAGVAVIATDTARHVDDAVVALDLGMHVLCEKPLATRLGEAGVLPAARRGAATVFCVGYLLRTDEGLSAFRAALPRIGLLHSVRIEARSYLPDWRPGRDYRTSYSASPEQGGVLRDLIHEVNYALSLFGMPRVVRGTASNLGRLGIGAVETAECLWETDRVPQVSLGLDYLTRTPVRFVRASGAEGEITYDFLRRELRSTFPGGPEFSSFPPIGRHERLVAQARAFLDRTAGSGGEVLASLEEGLADLAVVDAWMESASSGMAAPVEGSGGTPVVVPVLGKAAG